MLTLYIKVEENQESLKKDESIIWLLFSMKWGGWGRHREWWSICDLIEDTMIYVHRFALIPKLIDIQ